MKNHCWCFDKTKCIKCKKCGECIERYTEIDRKNGLCGMCMVEEKEKNRK